MTTLRILPVALFLALCALPACHRDDSAVAEKLDRIAARLDSMEKTIAGQPRGAAGAAGQRAPRPKPKPELTYSVPVHPASRSSNSKRSSSVSSSRVSRR